MKIYHGSPFNITSFILYPDARTKNIPVLFASPNKTFALCFLAKWKDNDFFQCVYDKDSRIHLEEKYLGAFDKVYKNKKGYLYELDMEDFYQKENLMRLEYITDKIPKILKIEEYDAYKKLKEEEEQGRLFIKTFSY